MSSSYLIIAAHSGVVEVVLLGIASGLDNLWTRDISNRRQRKSSLGSWRRNHVGEGLPQTDQRFRLRFPWSRCGGSHWLGSALLLRLRLWHQIPQLPKEMMRTILKTRLCSLQRRNITISVNFCIERFFHSYWDTPLWKFTSMQKKWNIPAV